jgi:hypothetical protein
LAAGVFYSILTADPGLLTEPFTITGVSLGSGGTGPGLNYAPTWVNPGQGTLPVPVPVDIAYPGGGSIKVTPTVYPSPKNLPTVQGQPISPGIFVYMPEIGLAINFSPVNLTLIFTTPQDSPLTQAPPQIIYPTPLQPTNPCLCPPTDNTKVLCLLRELETGLLQNGYTYSSHAGASGQTGVVSGITDELFSVEVEVSEIPQGEKVQFYPSPAPDVYFFGWISFITGSLPGARTPISFSSNTFRAPPDATGYLYALHNSCSAVSTYTTRVKNPFASLC